jgi:urea carboxylase / allophanate hydrolase
MAGKNPRGKKPSQVYVSINHIETGPSPPAGTITRNFPLTIPQWVAAQTAGNSIDRLLSLLDCIKAANSNAWISFSTPDQITSQWEHVASLRSQGHELPLFGVPFAVKDNIDAAGLPTTAACPAYAAVRGTVSEDAPVVARLKAGGAILIGKTNLDQFATGLVGTRSPYGAVPNAFDPTRVSGGSSSGSGFVVSNGLVPFSLGTDTAGSGRVPADLNNIVGLKPTRGALSARGVVPACRTLDCVSIFTLTVEDAETVLGVAEGYDEVDSYSRRRPPLADRDRQAADTHTPRIAICASPNWFSREHQANAYETALKQARALGWKLEETDFSDLLKLANLLYEEPWVAERYAAISEFIQTSPDETDPVVRGILKKAETSNAVDYFSTEYLRQDLTREVTTQFAGYDAILVLTTPTFPTMADLLLEPVLENSILGTYTNFVNFLDWPAIAIPAGFRDDGLPFGNTLISTTWEEPKLFALSRQLLSVSERRLGATSLSHQESLRNVDSTSVSSENIQIAVVEAHLRGFPLNSDLVTRDATFVQSTQTASKYQLHALASISSPVKKPGLRRVNGEGSGHAIEVEVWSLPKTQLASFVQTIVTPLGIGSIELQDGSWVHGFICEPYGIETAVDVSKHGGWRGYIKSITTPAGGPTNRTEATNNKHRVPRCEEFQARINCQPW